MYVMIFFLSQAVWTPQKWISESVDVWRTHKRLKRFASLAELKILDVNGPFISATVQTIICYLLILPHFVPWNHFIHLFYKYLWSGWCVLSTLLAAEISLHKAHSLAGMKQANGQQCQEGCIREAQEAQQRQEGAPDQGLPRAPKASSSAPRSQGWAAVGFLEEAGRKGN